EHRLIDQRPEEVDVIDAEGSGVRLAFEPDEHRRQRRLLDQAFLRDRQRQGQGEHMGPAEAPTPDGVTDHHRPAAPHAHPAPAPHTHMPTARMNSELNRGAPGNTSATSGATNTSVSAGKARFQTEATAPSAIDMSTPPAEDSTGKPFVPDLGRFPNPRAPAEAPAGPVVTSSRGHIRRSRS